MKNVLAAFLISVLLSGNLRATELPWAECPVQGEPLHWIADYCMLTLETDDEIAAGDCIAQELAMASKDPCEAKLHYKRAMCGAVVARDGSGSVEQCLADCTFAGRTVANEGVGARHLPGGASSDSRRGLKEKATP